jgi:hypothetical protein
MILLEELDDKAKEAISFLAAEFKYAMELKKEFGTLKAETANEAAREAKRMLRLYRWLARSERKADRDEEAVESLLKRLEEILPGQLKGKARTLIQQLRIANRTLKTLASMYRGDLKIDLKKIRRAEAISAKISDSVQVGVLLHRFDQDLQGLLTWIEANDALLRQIDAWDEELKEKAG